MPGVCLDASYCLDFLKGLEAAVSKAREWDESATELFLPVPAALEVLLWGRRHGDQSMRRTAELLERNEILDSTLEVANEAARLGIDCARRGGTVPNMDLLIAATARLHRLPLVTRDSDFHRIPGLTIESY